MRPDARRPILRLRRLETRALCSSFGLVPVEDPSNLDPAFRRNRVRHEVLPLLETIRPGAGAALARFATRASEADAALEPVVEQAEREAISVAPDGALTLATEGLVRYHPHVRARVLRRALRHRGIVLGAAGTQAALQFIREGASGGILVLPGGVRMERAFGTIVIRPGRATESDRPLAIDGPGTGRGHAVIGGTRVEVEWSPAPRDVRGDVAVFDPSALRFPLELRAWKPGDRIPFDYGSKKLKKLFAERRLATFERSRIPVLAESGDRVLWVVGQARSTVAVPAADGPILQISVSNVDRR
jgi:tRNA(Ile)-lysidine synthase